MTQLKREDTDDGKHLQDDKPKDWFEELQKTYPPVPIRGLTICYTKGVDLFKLAHRNVFIDFEGITKVICPGPSPEIFHVSGSTDPATLSGNVNTRPSKGLECFIHNIFINGWKNLDIPENAAVIIWPTDVYITLDIDNEGKTKNTFTVSVHSRMYHPELAGTPLENIGVMSTRYLSIRHNVKDLEIAIKILKSEFEPQGPRSLAAI